MELSLYTNGGGRGNGGPAAIAWIIENASGQILDDGVEVIGPATNNRAEYRALLSGLKACQYYRPARVRCYSDSELMVKQLNGDYKIKNADLKTLCDAVHRIAAAAEITYHYVPREHPRIRQVNRALRAARDASTQEP